MLEEGLRKNPEWQKYKDRSFRMPNQFGGLGDNGEGMPEVTLHQNDQGIAIISEGINHGVDFPIETGQPMPAVTMIPVFDARQNIIGYDGISRPIQGLSEPLPHGLDK